MVKPATSIRRFVVLHHQVGRDLQRTNQSHFDWLFEDEDSLTSFATEEIEGLVDRVFRSQLIVDAIALPDHRKEYLSFEGRLPPKVNQPDRGHVKRIASGTFDGWTDHTRNPIESLNLVNDWHAIMHFDLPVAGSVSIKIQRIGGKECRMKFVKAQRRSI